MGNSIQPSGNKREFWELLTIVVTLGQNVIIRPDLCKSTKNKIAEKAIDGHNKMW